MRLANTISSLLAGEPEGGTVDAHGIQAYYTGLVAAASNMSIAIEASPEGVVLEAKPLQGKPDEAEAAGAKVLEEKPGA